MGWHEQRCVRDCRICFEGDVIVVVGKVVPYTYMLVWEGRYHAEIAPRESVLAHAMLHLEKAR